MWGLDSGPWRGLLLWNDGDGSNPAAPMSITGQGDMNIAGTIYAPGSDVKLEGNGSSTSVLAVQIISWTWDIGGNGDLYMPYDPSQLYRITQRGLVHYACLGGLERTCRRQAERQGHRLTRIAGAVDARAAKPMLRFDPPGAERHHVATHP